MKFRVRYRNEYLNPSDVRIDGAGEVRRAVNYLGGRTWLDITDDCTVELISDFKDQNGKSFAVGDIAIDSCFGTGEIAFKRGSFIIRFRRSNTFLTLTQFNDLENLIITGTIHDKGGE